MTINYRTVFSSRRASCAVAFASAVCLAVGAARPAAAQLTEATVASSASATAPASTTDRDREFAALAKDVDSFEREFGLIKRVVKLVGPSVVHIEANLLAKYRSGLLSIEEAGSGVIVQFGATNYIITNRHVIRHSSAELVSIHFADGRVAHPDRIWSDQDTDVAVMSISTPDLISARLGDSNALEIGDFVLAIGSPFGLSQSVTRGIVSAKGRHNLDLGDNELQLQDFIQTDAAINPGNSGGPLVNLRGEVVGLNTAIASSSGGNEGIGFSIPINIVSRVARQLVEKNAVSRGYLGVTLDRDFNEKRATDLGLHQLTGARVSGVQPNTPAQHSDLRVNDVILKFNGVQVENEGHLRGLIKLTEVGKPATLVIFRDGQAVPLSVDVGDLKDNPQKDQ
ncbi:MAG TPA: trypsin-like peptidase domain-containing protein [Lacipirellulaceae bacterium]|jgi:serine protease Do